MEDKDPGRYIPSTFLLYSWGSLFGVPSKVPSELATPKGYIRAVGVMQGSGFGAKVIGLLLRSPN